jgi:hypothetical protein
VAALANSKGPTSLYGLNRRDLDQLLKDWVASHRDLIGSQRPTDAQLEAVGKFMMAIGQKLDEPDGGRSIVSTVYEQICLSWISKELDALKYDFDISFSWFVAFDKSTFSPWRW